MPYFHIAGTMKQSIFTKKKSNISFLKNYFLIIAFFNDLIQFALFFEYMFLKYCSALKSFFFWKNVFNFWCKFDFSTFFLMALLDRSAKVSGCSPAKQMISATSLDDVFAWPAPRSTSRASRGKQFLHAAGNWQSKQTVCTDFFCLESLELYCFLFVYY